MPKTEFIGGVPGLRTGTKVTAEFLKTIYFTNGGHDHQDTNEDGHAGRINPETEIHSIGRPLLDAMYADGDGNVLWGNLTSLLGLTFDFYPHVPGNGILSVATSTGSITVNAGQVFSMEGFEFNTSLWPVEDRTFTTEASKTYHLRFSSGTLTFNLQERTPGADDGNPIYDSQKTDMLLGKVTTDAGNSPTYLGLINKMTLTATYRQSQSGWQGTGNNQAIFGITYNWARQPLIINHEFYSTQGSPGTETDYALSINEGHDGTQTFFINRYGLNRWYQRDYITAISNGIITHLIAPLT